MALPVFAPSALVRLPLRDRIGARRIYFNRATAIGALDVLWVDLALVAPIAYGDAHCHRRRTLAGRVRVKAVVEVVPHSLAHEVTTWDLPLRLFGLKSVIDV
jgi:hypothetical protein